MWDFYPRGSIGKNSMWDFYPRGSIGKNSMWDFYPRGSIGKNSMWNFYPRGRLVRILCGIFTSEGCASKNDARFLRRRVVRPKIACFEKLCTRRRGGECENRFIRMEIVPVSNEPIGGSSRARVCIRPQFEWFMPSSASPHRHQSRQRP